MLKGMARASKLVTNFSAKIAQSAGTARVCSVSETNTIVNMTATAIGDTVASATPTLNTNQSQLRNSGTSLVPKKIALT